MSVSMTDSKWSKFEMGGTCVIGHPAVVRSREQTYTLHQGFTLTFLKLVSNQLHFKFADGRDWRVTYHAATILGPVSFQVGNVTQWEMQLLSEIALVTRSVDVMRVDLSMTSMDIRPV